MAGVTGLEPATSGVTGQHSNRLSYTPGEQVLPLGNKVPPVKPRPDPAGGSCMVGGDGLEPPAYWV